MMEEQKDNFDALSYEEMIGRLEKLIHRMEKGDLPLEESLGAFEEGMELIAAAKGRLDAYRIKIDETVSKEH